MNELNVASLEASKRLIDTGIVLETDAVWYLLKDGDWYLSGNSMPMSQIDQELPAPSFTEVWRELPFQSYIKKLDDGSTLVWICDDDTDGKYIESNMIANTNPADALIDLLVWLKGEGK